MTSASALQFVQRSQDNLEVGVGAVASRTGVVVRAVTPEPFMGVVYPVQERGVFYGTLTVNQDDRRSIVARCYGEQLVAYDDTGEIWRLSIAVPVAPRARGYEARSELGAARRRAKTTRKHYVSNRTSSGNANCY